MRIKREWKIYLDSNSHVVEPKIRHNKPQGALGLDKAWETLSRIVIRVRDQRGKNHTLRDSHRYYVLWSPSLRIENSYQGNSGVPYVYVNQKGEVLTPIYILNQKTEEYEPCKKAYLASEEESWMGIQYVNLTKKEIEFICKKPTQTKTKKKPRSSNTKNQREHSGGYAAHIRGVNYGG